MTTKSREEAIEEEVAERIHISSLLFFRQSFFRQNFKWEEGALYQTERCFTLNHTRSIHFDLVVGI